MLVANDAGNLAVYRDLSVAAHYAALEGLTACERFLFDKYIGRGMDVLDIGVGGGRTTPYLSSVAARYLGVDYSEPMVHLCRDKFPQLEFLVADASNLPQLRDSSFDAIVIAFNGLDYVTPRERCLQECFRLLRPGGKLIFSSHNPRAIIVRPAWSRERLQSIATRLAGKRAEWATAMAILLTPAKALHSLCRSVKDSLIRAATRLSKPVFWIGHGQALDPAHGGLMTHYWIPKRAIAEVNRYGFEFLACVGNDFPRSSNLLMTDWYYYVFSRNELCGSNAKCA